MLEYELTALVLPGTLAEIALTHVVIFVTITAMTRSLSTGVLMTLTSLVTCLVAFELIPVMAGRLDIIVAINILLTTCISVTQMVFITHTYLMTEAPSNVRTNSLKRRYKASRALQVNKKPTLVASVCHIGVLGLYVLAFLTLQPLI